MNLFSDIGGSLLEQYAKGGPAMHPIAFLSVVSLALILSKIYAFKKAGTDVDGLIRGVRRHVLDGRYKQAIETCERHRGPVAVALKVGLLHSDEPNEEVERHIEAAAIHSLARLQRYLGGLATIATIAPLIGFFGTVVGMIMSFEVIATDMSKPELVAKGIAVALLTTAFGLLVAVMTQPFYNYFIGRLSVFGGEIEMAAHSLLDVLKKRRRLVEAESTAAG